MTLPFTATPDTTPPTITGRTPAPNATGVPIGTDVTVTFDEPMDPSTITDSTFTLRAQGAGADVPATVSYAGTTATLDPSADLDTNTPYTVTVAASVTDTSGNALGTTDTWTFTTPTGGATDTTVADFGAGTTGANTYVSETGNGEVILAPTVGAEFSGTSLPSGWESGPWTGGATTVAGGSMTVDGAWARTTALYDPGHVLEFRATFGDATFLNGGFGVDLNTVSRWAMFGIGGSSGQLYVRVAGSPDVALGADYLGSPRTYRIEWTADAIRFYIDGSLVHTHDGAVTGQMRPIFSDFNAGGPSLSVDWLRMSPYSATGTFTSRVLDAGADRVFDTIGWNATIPAGSSVEISVRTGSTATPDESWTGFVPVATSGSPIATVGRYTQYQAVLASDGLRTPALTDVTLGSVGAPPNAAPVASAATDQDGTEGVEGSFDLGSFTDAGDAGPWDVTVDWGDGSTPGTFEVTPAGPIGTRAHTYTDDATYDVSVTVSDGSSRTPRRSRSPWPTRPRS